MSCLQSAWSGSAPPRLLHRLEFFRIRRVEIAGLQYLAPAKVIAVLGLGSRGQCFRRPGAAGSRLRALPGVASAVVQTPASGHAGDRTRGGRRRWRLRPGAAGWRCWTRAAGCFPSTPPQPRPICRSPRAPTRWWLECWPACRSIDPALFARVRTAWRVQNDVTPRCGRASVLVRPGGDGGGYTSGDGGGSRTWPGRGANITELDGRYAGQVIVRWAGA